ncbi:MAG: hypothetical protein GF329_04970 [Candidatus Lokiarchaeota archaeon]|nr:hypothetical protein [Candidatus Lokiarchaeota archaeon]
MTLIMKKIEKIIPIIILKSQIVKSSRIVNIPRGINAPKLMSVNIGG